MEIQQISNFISTEIGQALGWTVIHSLWQGTLIALILALGNALFTKISSKTRYLIYLSGLGMTLVWAMITFFSYLNQGEEALFLVQVGVLTDPNIAEANTGEVSFLSTAYFIQYFENNLPLIVSLWLLGMAFFLIRFLGGLAYVGHLKVNQVYAPDQRFVDMMLKLQSQLGLSQPIQLLESAKVNVPMTIGYLKPVILMPVGAFLALSPKQIEAILAHELAHIKRHDYFINIFQSLIEVLFYYHPAIWWISAKLRIERENACDDEAINLYGNDLEYAKSLLSLQAFSQDAPAFAMAFSNRKRKNHLLNRVKRILNHPINKNSIMEKLSITSLLLLCIVLLSMRSNTQEEQHHGEAVKVQVDLLEPTDVVEEVEPEVVAELNVFVEESTDTLPKGKINVTLTKNGEKIEAKINEGEIKELKIDGEVQAQEDFEAYLPIIEDVLVTPPLHHEPTILHIEPSFELKEAIVPDLKINSKIQIKTDQDLDGNTILFITKDDQDEPIELKIKGGDGNSIIMLGDQEISSDEDYFIIDGDANSFVLSPQKFKFDLKLPYYENFNGLFNDTFPPFEFDPYERDLFRENEQIQKLLKENEAKLFERLKGLELLMENEAFEDGERSKEAELLMKELRMVEEKQHKAIQEVMENYKKENKDKEEEIRMVMEKMAKQRSDMNQLREKQIKELLMQREEMLAQKEIALRRAEEAKKASLVLVEKYKAEENERKLQLINALLKDGHIDSTDNYKIVITEKDMKVNGKKMSKSDFEKYAKLYLGKEKMKGKYKISISNINK